MLSGRLTLERTWAVWSMGDKRAGRFARAYPVTPMPIRLVKMTTTVRAFASLNFLPTPRVWSPLQRILNHKPDQQGEKARHRAKVGMPGLDRIYDEKDKDFDVTYKPRPRISYCVPVYGY